MDKKCCGCEKIKSLNEFYVAKGKEKGQSLCKSCFNNYCIKRWQETKIKAIQYKGNKCVDCDVPHPEYPSDVYEFHHLNKKEKDFNWTQLRLKSWDKIKLELDKCVLLCANCHRIRHYKENHE